MHDVKVTTAAELDRMTMAERQAHLEASIVRDPSKVSEPFLAKVRARLQERINTQPHGE